MKKFTKKEHASQDQKPISIQSAYQRYHMGNSILQMVFLIIMVQGQAV